MANDDNGTKESTIRDILTLGGETARARADDLLEEGKQRAGELSDTVLPYLTEGRRRTEELSDRTQKGYTNMLECARAEEHLWYQMWSTGSEMFTDAGKALLGSTPSELKGKSLLNYVGGLLGGGVISLFSVPAFILEETIRYTARKISEKK